MEVTVDNRQEWITFPPTTAKGHYINVLHKQSRRKTQNTQKKKNNNWFAGWNIALLFPAFCWWLLPAKCLMQACGFIKRRPHYKYFLLFYRVFYFGLPALRASDCNNLLIYFIFVNFTCQFILTLTDTHYQWVNGNIWFYGEKCAMMRPKMVPRRGLEPPRAKAH